MSSTPKKDLKTAGKAGNAPNLAQDPPVLQRPARAANISSRPTTPGSQTARASPSTAGSQPSSRTAGNSPPSAGSHLPGKTTGDSAKKSPPRSSQTTSTNPGLTHGSKTTGNSPPPTSSQPSGSTARNSTPPAGSHLSGKTTGDGARKSPLRSSQITGINPGLTPGPQITGISPPSASSQPSGRTIRGSASNNPPRNSQITGTNPGLTPGPQITGISPPSASSQPSGRTTGGSASNSPPRSSQITGTNPGLTPGPQITGNSPASASSQPSGRTTGDSAGNSPPRSSQITGTGPGHRQRKALGGPANESHTPSPTNNPQATGDTTSRRVSAGATTGSEKADHPPTIVWACDGTGQDGTSKTPNAKLHRSNVYKLWYMFNRVLPAKNGKLKAIYHEGPASGMQGNKTDQVKAVVSAATGNEVEACIRDGLEKLSENYDDKESIILIGFSRGAFVARCLHSLIHWLGGLIGNDTKANLDDAYNSWWDEKPVTKEQLQAWNIRRTKVSHLVLFDTVNSVRNESVRVNPRLAKVDSTLDGGVDYFSHAIAMNENRKLFAAIPIAKCEDSNTEGENVYFAGVHTNIGGGHATTGLDLISLSWAASEIKSKSKIAFDATYIQELYASLEVQGWDVNYHNSASSVEHLPVLQTSRIPAYQSLHGEVWKDISQEARDGMFKLHFSVRAIMDCQKISNMQYPKTYTISPLAVGNSSSLPLTAEISQAYETYNAKSGRTITVRTKSNEPTVFHIEESGINPIETAYLRDFCNESDIQEAWEAKNPSAVGMVEWLQVLQGMQLVQKKV